MANLSIIKELLKEQKVSIRDFAKELGITEQGLQKIIRDSTTKVETLELIAKKLNVSAALFFDEQQLKNYQLGSERNIARESGGSTISDAATISALQTSNAEKDEQIKIKDEQIKNMQQQINNLLEIVTKSLN